MSCTGKPERFKTEAVEKRIKYLRKHLPILNARKIRRHRIPYVEALCLELEEDEFPFSAKYLRSLVEFETEQKRISDEQQLPWGFLMLQDQKNVLDFLYKHLKKAEQAEKEGDYSEKCEQFLKMAIYFNTESKSWCWLTKRLYEDCINSAECCVDDGGEKESIARYLYGSFLVENDNDLEKAKDQLGVCRELSSGKSWSASDYLGIPKKSLFTECCSYLYKTLFMIAQSTMENNPQKASRICSVAQKRAADAEDRQGEANCMMLLGLCEMKAGDAHSAITIFNKVLNIHHSESNSSGICECRIQLALANSRVGNIMEANYHLQQMLEYAEKNNLKFYYGQAHRFLGELKIKAEEPHIATPLLIKALHIFYELNDRENLEQVRTLAAIAAGQELFPSFVDLTVSCLDRTKSSEQFKTLIKWKETREAFWDETKHETIERDVFQRNFDADK